MPIIPITVANIAAISLRSTMLCIPVSATRLVTASFMNSFHENAITKASAADSAIPVCLRTSFWNAFACLIIFILVLLVFLSCFFV